MNIQLAETEEFVDMKSTGGLGQVLIRYVGPWTTRVGYCFEMEGGRGEGPRGSVGEGGGRDMDEELGLTRNAGVITSFGYRQLLIARGRRWRSREE